MQSFAQGVTGGVLFGVLSVYEVLHVVWSMKVQPACRLPFWSSFHSRSLQSSQSECSYLVERPGRMFCHGAAPIGLEGLEGALGRDGKLRCPEECFGTIFTGLLDTGLFFGEGLLFFDGLFFLGSGDLLRESRLERDRLRPGAGSWNLCCCDVSFVANGISA